MKKLLIPLALAALLGYAGTAKAIDKTNQQTPPTIGNTETQQTAGTKTNCPKKATTPKILPTNDVNSPFYGYSAHFNPHNLVRPFVLIDDSTKQVEMPFTTNGADTHIVYDFSNSAEAFKQFAQYDKANFQDILSSCGIDVLVDNVGKYKAIMIPDNLSTRLQDANNVAAYASDHAFTPTELQGIKEGFYGFTAELYSDSTGELLESIPGMLLFRYKTPEQDIGQSPTPQKNIPQTPNPISETPKSVEDLLKGEKKLPEGIRFNCPPDKTYEVDLGEPDKHHGYIAGQFGWDQMRGTFVYGLNLGVNISDKVALTGSAGFSPVSKDLDVTNAFKGPVNHSGTHAEAVETTDYNGNVYTITAGLDFEVLKNIAIGLNLGYSIDHGQFESRVTEKICRDDMVLNLINYDKLVKYNQGVPTFGAQLLFKPGNSVLGIKAQYFDGVPDFTTNPDNIGPRRNLYNGDHYSIQGFAGFQF
jgi:hypothetical protein